MIRRTRLWNTRLLEAVAGLGHGDLLVVGDAGLPRPASVPLLDLAVEDGMPSLIQVLAPLLHDGVFETAYLAEELRAQAQHAEITDVVATLPTSWTSHDELKKLTHSARLFVRTGDARPYSNVVLRGGVSF